MLQHVLKSIKDANVEYQASFGCEIWVAAEGKQGFAFFSLKWNEGDFLFIKPPRVFPFGWFTFLTCHSNRNKSGWNFFLEKFKTNLPSSSKRIYFKIFRLKKGNFLIKILGQNKCIIQCLTHFVIIVWKTNEKAGKILVTSSAE